MVHAQLVVSVCWHGFEMLVKLVMSLNKTQANKNVGLGNCCCCDDAMNCLTDQGVSPDQADNNHFFIHQHNLFA